MNVLNNLTIQNLMLNKKRTIVTLIGIILSGAMICGVAAIVASFQDLVVQSAMETDGNFHATFYEVRSDHRKYITGNSYTELAMLSRDLGFVPIDSPDSGSKPYLFVKDYDTAAFNHMPIALTEGRFPEKAGEMVISEEIFRKCSATYAIGQTITLNVGVRMAGGEQLTYEPYNEAETLKSLFTETYTISGFIARPRFETFTGVPGYGVIAYLDESRLSDAELLNVSILGKKPRQIYDRVPEMAETAGAKRYIYNNELLKWLGISRNDHFNTMLHSVALIVILLIVIGSVAVIYNAFAISVSERKKQFGMLASIGATPQQIRRTVFYEGAILGIIGIPIGVLSGILGIGITLSVVSELARGAMFGENLSIRLIISPATVLVTVFFVGLVIFFSAYVPARTASRISPIDAIRLSTDINLESKKLKTSRVIRFFFGVEGEFALKNLKRNRKRYRATVFSLFISIVLFVSFSAFMKYGFQSTDIYYSEKPYNVEVAKHNIPLEKQKEFIGSIVALDGINRYAVTRSLWCSTSGLEITQFGKQFRQHIIEQDILRKNENGKYSLEFNIVALDSKALDRYLEENGINGAELIKTGSHQAILVNMGTIQSNRMIQFEPFNVETISTLLLGRPDTDKDNSPLYFNLEIGAVTDILPFGVSQYMVGYAGGAYSAVTLIISESTYESMRAIFSYNSDYYDYDQARLFIDAEDSAALVEQIVIINMQYPDGSLFVRDISAMINETKRITTIISIFLYGFVTLITLIGVTNIFNTISTNIALRRREFAMLKSVGLTPGGFNKIINYESIFYGLKALLYGLPVSILISILIFRSFGNLFEFSFFLPWKAIAICILGVFVIVSITMLHASARLKKEDIIDALRAENL